MIRQDIREKIIGLRRKIKVNILKAPLDCACPRCLLLNDLFEQFGREIAPSLPVQEYDEELEVPRPPGSEDVHVYVPPKNEE